MAEGDLSEDVGVETCLSIGVLECLLPVGGRELEDTTCGPVGEQTEQVSNVGERFEPMELAAGQEGHESGVCVSGIMGTQKHPIFSADGFSSKLGFRPVV